MRLTLPRERYPGDAAGAFFDRLAERLAELPGVRAVSAASQFPPTATLSTQFTARAGRGRQHDASDGGDHDSDAQLLRDVARAAARRTHSERHRSPRYAAGGDDQSSVREPVSFRRRSPRPAPFRSAAPIARSGGRRSSVSSPTIATTASRSRSGRRSICPSVSRPSGINSSCSCARTDRRRASCHRRGRRFRRSTPSSRSILRRPSTRRWRHRPSSNASRRSSSASLPASRWCWRRSASTA